MQYTFMDTRDASTLRMASDCLLQVAPVEGWILLGKLCPMRKVCKAHHTSGSKDRTDALPGEDRAE